MNVSDISVPLLMAIERSLDLTSNLFLLLLNDVVRAESIIDIIYHFSGFNYWLTAVFVGDGGILDAASKNMTAASHFSHLINYVGSHSRSIFGDMEGGGAGEVLSDLRIDEKLAERFWYSVRLGVEVVVKLFNHTGG